MKTGKCILGKAFAGIALALLMVVQCVPTAALAQQGEAEVAMLSTQSSKKTVKGTGWKLTLPTYWRGKVKTSSYAYDGKTTTQVFSKKGASKGSLLLSISEMSSQSVKTITKSTWSCYTGKKVKLKNGKKAKLYKPAQGTTCFFVKVSKGKYLCVQVLDPRSGDGQSTSVCNHIAKLQSFGKSSKYTNGVPTTCLKGIAKRLSY